MARPDIDCPADVHHRAANMADVAQHLLRYVAYRGPHPANRRIRRHQLVKLTCGTIWADRAEDKLYQQRRQRRES